MQALLTAYGFEGYGRFWALNEAVSACDNARMDLSRRVNRMALAAKLRFSEADLDVFLRFLADPDLDLINFHDGIVTTDRTQECFDLVQREREHERERYERRRQKKLHPENGLFRPENQHFRPENENSGRSFIQSKVNKSKVNKSGGGRSEYSDLPPSTETPRPPGENPPGKSTLPPPPQVLQKIKEASSRAGYAIDDSLAEKLARLDPSWFEGSYTFFDYAAEYVRGHPKYRDKPLQELRNLYRKALWSWDNIREQYPAWKAERIKAERLAALEHAEKNPPSACPTCGIAVKYLKRCPKCNGTWFWDKEKSEHYWEVPEIITGDKIRPQEVPKAVYF